ncbi:MAG: WG repeat-containing protein, partial [Fulvivirga sp.]|nr:WG repeat-containing protein [Fulvivirga sp.]
MSRSIITVTLIFFLVSLCQAHLYRMEKNERWGYINTQGDWVIEPQYLWATGFSDGIAAVASASTGCWLLIDESGKITSDKEICGYGTSTTNFYPQQLIDPFAEGLAPANIDGQINYINKQAQIVIEGPFRSAFPHSEGLARVQNAENRKYGFIDLQGNVIIDYKFDDALDFQNGLAAAAIIEDNKEKWGFINKKGQWQIAPQFHEVGSFHEGLAWAQTKPEKQKNGYYSLTGAINKSGEWKIKPLIKEIKDFSEGLAPARKDWDWGYINKNGTWKVGAEFDEAKPFSESLGVVKNDDGWFFIDQQGKKAFENPKMKELIYLFPFDGELAMGVFSFTDQKGYGSIGSGDYRQFSEAYYGYINKKGEWVYLPPKEEITKRKEALRQEKEAKKAAEEREKERKQQQEMAAFENCTKQVAYGSQSDNWIEISIKGNKRIFYFDKSTIAFTDNNQIEVYFPPFGLSPELREARSDQMTSGLFAGMVKSMINKWSKFNLKIDPNATFSSDKYEFTNTNIFNIDCLTDLGNKYIRNLMDSYKSQMEHSTKDEQGEIVVTFKSLLNTDSSTYLQVHASDDALKSVELDKGELKQLKNKYNLPDDKTELVDMIYYPEMGFVSFREQGAFRYSQIFLADNEDKLVGYPSPQAFNVHEFNKVDDESIIISQYLIGKPQDRTAPSPAIEDPLLVSSEGLHLLNLGEHNLQKVYVSGKLIIVDSNPLLIKKEDLADGLQYSKIPEEKEERKPRIGLLELPSTQDLPEITGNYIYTLSSPSENINVAVSDRQIVLSRSEVEASQQLVAVKEKMGQYYYPFMEFALMGQEDSKNYMDDPQKYREWWANQLKKLGVEPPDSEDPLDYQKALGAHYNYIDNNIYELLLEDYIKSEYGHLLKGMQKFEKLMAGDKTKEQLQMVAKDFNVKINQDLSIDEQIKALEDSIVAAYPKDLLRNISRTMRPSDDKNNAKGPIVNIDLSNNQQQVSYQLQRPAGLTVKVTFDDKAMQIMSNHPEQEMNKKSWKATDGLTDINYLLAALPSLDLHKNYSRELYFTYYLFNTISSFSSSTGSKEIYQVS